MSLVYVLDNDMVKGTGSIVSFKPNGSDIKVLYRHSGFGDGIDQGPDGTIYWSDMGHRTDSAAAFGNRDGSISTLVEENGVWTSTVICKGEIYTPKQVFVHDGHVYFCDREGLGLYKLSTKTYELDLLFSSGDPSTQMFDLVRQNVGCCVKDGYVYFTQKGPPKGGVGRILRLPLDSSLPATERSDLEVLLDKLPEPIDLMFGTSGKLYWTDRGAPPFGNSLNKGDLVGSKILNHEVVATGFNETIGLAVTKDETQAYVTDIKGKAYVVDLATGEHTVIYQGTRLTGILLVE